MADKKISELAVATSPSGTELIEIVQGGVNKQTTLQAVADLAGSGDFLPLTLTEETYVDGDGNNLYINAPTLGITGDSQLFVSSGGDMLISSSGETTIDTSTNALNLNASQIVVNAAQIKNIADGIDSQDAVTKSQLDAAVAGGGAVDSVNSQTGVVVLDAGDVGADPAGTAAAAVVGLAPLASPTFTGTPVAPTAAAATNNTQLATTEYADRKIDSYATLKTKSGSHTLDSGDLSDVEAGKDVLLIMTNSSAAVVTIPLNSAQGFSVGKKITVVWTGTGSVSVAATGGVTINSANGWLNIAARYASVTATKTGTDEWLLQGALIP